MSQITRRFTIPAMSVQASADSISKHMQYQNGILAVSVSIEDKTMTVTYDDTKTSIRTIIQEVRACGYQANLLSRQELSTQDTSVQDLPTLSYTPWIYGLAVSLLCLLPVPQLLPFCGAMGMFWFLRNHLVPLAKKQKETQFFLCIVCTLIALIVYGLLTHRSVRMPITSLVFLPIFYIYQQRILSLPKEEIHTQKIRYANVYHDHQENTKEMQAVDDRDVIILRQNEIVPIDGIVLSGFALCDESILTGNPVPVEKNAGRYLYANTKITHGSLTLKIDTLNDISTLERFQQYSEQAILHHESASSLTKIGKELYLFILFVSLLLFIGYTLQTKDIITAAMIALCVLAASCPSVFTLITRQEMVRTAKDAMKHHILYKTVEGMRDITEKDYIVFDQDGVLTESQISIIKLVNAVGTSMTKLEYIAYALSSKSDLPYAKAMTAYLRKQKIQKDTVSDFRSMSRLGTENFKRLSNYALIRFDALDDLNLIPSEDLADIQQHQARGCRIYLFTENQHYIGYAVAQKKMLNDVAQHLQSFKDAGYGIGFLLSGPESEQTYLNEILQPNQSFHVSSQTEKQEILQSLKQKQIPLIYVSSTPIALDADIMVQMDAGANIDEPTADIVLTRNQLADLCYAIRQSKNTFHAIEKKQILLVLYHIGISILFGTIIPTLLHMPAPLLLCYVCNILIIHLILRK